MNLKQLQSQLRNLAARGGVGDEHLPTFGSSADGARPHIEEHSGVYYYVVQDRGTEVVRRLFVDEDELFYHVLERATSEVAGDQEVATRRDELHDSRREQFRIHEELLRRIKPEWAVRVSQEHAKVLRKYPFDDAAVLRLRRFQALQASGLHKEEAWKRACVEYPEPIPEET